MTAPRILKAAAVVVAIFLLVLTAGPADAGSSSALRAGKLQGPQAIAPNSAVPQGKVRSPQAIAPNSLVPQPSLPAVQKVVPGAQPAASGLPTGKRQHKPVIMTKPPAGASSKALQKIPTHQPPWSNPKLHGAELQPPASQVGGVTPDDGMPASGEGLAATQGKPAGIAGIRTEQLNNKYPENMK